MHISLQKDNIFFLTLYREKLDAKNKKKIPILTQAGISKK